MPRATYGPRHSPIAVRIGSSYAFPGSKTGAGGLSLEGRDAAWASPPREGPMSVANRGWGARAWGDGCPLLPTRLSLFSPL